MIGVMTPSHAHDDSALNGVMWNPGGREEDRVAWSEDIHNSWNEIGRQ